MAPRAGGREGSEITPRVPIPGTSYSEPAAEACGPSRKLGREDSDTLRCRVLGGVTGAWAQVLV